METFEQFKGEDLRRWGGLRSLCLSKALRSDPAAAPQRAV